MVTPAERWAQGTRVQGKKRSEGSFTVGSKESIDVEAIEDVVGGEAGAAGLLDGEPEVLEAAGGVSVGAEDEGDTPGVGAAGELCVEIEASSAAVDLEGDSVLGGGVEEGFEVEVIAVTTAEDPARGVPDRGEETGVDGREEALGHLVSGELEVAVDGADDPVGATEEVVVHVEGAVFEDVDLDAGEDPDSVDSGVGCGDGVEVAGEAVGSHAVGDPDVLRVVGDGDEGVAEVPGGFGHLDDGVAPVGLGGVHVEVAADVVCGEEGGQAVVGGEVELVAAFPELGGDEVEAEGGEEVFLGAGGQDFVGVDSGDPVFADLEAHSFGPGSQGDMMLFAAGEVVECGAKDLGVDGAEVDLDAPAEADGGLGLAGGDDVGDFCEVTKGLVDGFGVDGGDEEVDVADGLAAAAQGAGDLDGLDLGEGGEVVAERFCDPAGFGQGDAIAGQFEAVDLGEDLLLGAGAEAGEFPDFAGLAGFFEGLDGGDAELVVDQLDPFGAEALDLEDLQEARVEVVEEVLEEVAGTAVADLEEIVGDALADARDGGDGPVVEEGFDGFGVAGDGPGGVLEGPDPEAVSSLDLKEGGDLGEALGVVAVVHGGLMWWSGGCIPVGREWFWRKVRGESTGGGEEGRGT